MKVEIWSDVACPWCYVGTARFERAVEQTGLDVDVVYRSFELDPTVPTGGDSPKLVDYLSEKFGGPERVASAHARLESAAEELDIDFRWSQMRRANTFDAHRLLGWTLRTGGPEKQRALKQALLRTYFTDGLDVTDHAVLANLADEVGLDRAAAAQLLTSDDEADHVRAEREEAYRNGINAVPTFIVEGKWMLQGALETEKWVKALTHMRGELAAEGEPAAT
jgi:predicted DsbA family dithiol-disulfide isomerase